jgi:GH25 family lysozyme M1 (1,4-beta-N-acetylmuramidase)
MTTSARVSGIVPSLPYRGIESFRYSDQFLFFAREQETRALLRYITVYRGVLFYGDSGSGKSSLINAGLIPMALKDNFVPDRLRVQPRRGEEIVVERISLSPGGEPPYLLSTFVSDQDTAARVALSTDEAEKYLRKVATQCPLVIFDQFEELVTLFEEPARGDTLDEARTAQAAILALINRLLRDNTLSVKLLFVFREDYLAKLTELLAQFPDLRDQYLRLTPPSIDALYPIVRGPFDRFPNHFGKEISPSLAHALEGSFAERSELGMLNLSVVQIVCLELWDASDPEARFRQKGVQGLLEDYLSTALDSFAADLRDPAVAVLSHMVTSAGTRTVVSEDELVDRVQKEEQLEPDVLRKALKALERDTRLVRGEWRRGSFYYEIESEFLVPWINQQKLERARRRAAIDARAEAESQFRARLVRSFFIVLAVALAAVIAALVIAVQERNDAIAARNKAQNSSNQAQAARATAASGSTAVSAALTQKNIALGKSLVARATAVAGSTVVSAALAQAQAARATAIARSTVVGGALAQAQIARATAVAGSTVVSAALAHAQVARATAIAGSTAVSAALTHAQLAQATAVAGSTAVSAALTQKNAALNQAKRAITRSINIKPDAGLYLSLANTEFLQGNLRGALAEYDKALALAPKNALAYGGRAMVRDRLGDYRGAIADYSHVITLTPKDGTAYAGRAKDRDATGDYRGAVADCARAILYLPKSQTGKRDTCTNHVQGVDVSHYQGQINWQELAQSGIKFAFVKATEGTGFEDPLFRTNWLAMKKAGILRGVYHYLRPDLNTPAQEADYFIKILQQVKLEPGDLPPVANVGPGNDATTFLKQWLSIVECRTGRIPLVFYGTRLQSVHFSPVIADSGYPLWVTSFQKSSPLVSGGWKQWTFWQYSETGHKIGISGAVDLDQFNGSLYALDKYIHIDSRTAGGCQTLGDTTDLTSASAHESAGFNDILKGNLSGARVEFSMAYNAYPTFHNVDEIYHLVLTKTRVEAFNRSSGPSRSVMLRSIIQQIITSYSWGMPPPILAQFQAKIGS